MSSYSSMFANVITKLLIQTNKVNNCGIASGFLEAHFCTGCCFIFRLISSVKDKYYDSDQLPSMDDCMDSQYHP